MANRIEAARSGRSKCVTCNVSIARGEARMTEEVTEAGVPGLITRFYHLKCAAATHPDLLHVALQDIRGELEIDREELEARIAPAIEALKRKRIAKYESAQAAKQAPALATDDRTLAALAQLEANPEDPDVLAIVADQLTLRGDPRGELITTQLSLAKIDRRPMLRPTDDEDEDDEDDDEEADADAEANEAMAKQLAHRYEELMLQLALPPLDKGDRALWGIGFVRRLELLGKTASKLAVLELWRHPSLQVVTELKLDLIASDAAAMASLAAVIRPTVKRLELGTAPALALDGVNELLAALPQLVSLVIVGRLRGPIAHAKLATLKLSRGTNVGDLQSSLQHVTADGLPALRELVIEGYDVTNLINWSKGNTPSNTKRTADDLHAIVSLLAQHGLLAQLTHLAIHGGMLSDAGIGELARSLSKRRLAKLDVTGTPLPGTARRQLEEMCDQLIGFTDATPRGDGELWVEHANQPTWGRGKIVRRFEGKLEIEWPKVGKKVFKADAAFLRFG